MGILTDPGRWINNRAARSIGSAVSTLGSAERSMNLVDEWIPIDILGQKNAGTATRRTIERTPVVGEQLGTAFDVGLSPLSLAAALVPPLAVARGAPLLTRMGAEATVGALGGVAGVEGAKLGEKLGGTPGAIGGGILGGILGGAGGVAAVRRGLKVPLSAAADPEGLKLPEFDAGLREAAPDVEPPFSRVPKERMDIQDVMDTVVRGKQRPTVLKENLPGLPEQIDEAIPGQPIERGRLVRPSMLTENADDRSIVDRNYSYAKDYDSVRGKAWMRDWYNMDADPIRADALEGGSDTRLRYLEGRFLRKDLRNSHPEGYVTLYRGEYTGHSFGEDVAPMFEQDFPIQSWSTDPNTASQFAKPFNQHEGTPPIIIERKIPIDDILGVGHGPEGEVLVLSRDVVPDEAWVRVTGAPKDITEEVSVAPVFEPFGKDGPEVEGFYPSAQARQLADKLGLEVGEPEIRKPVVWDELNPPLEKMAPELAAMSDEEYKAALRAEAPVGQMAGGTDPFTLRKEAEEAGHAVEPPKPPEGKVASLSKTREFASQFNATVKKLPDGTWEVTNAMGQVLRGTPEELAQYYKLPIQYVDLRMGGKATVGELVSLSEVEPGLTLSDKANDVFNRTSRFLFGKGTPPHPIATPLIRDYADNVAVLKDQGNAFAAETRVLSKGFPNATMSSIGLAGQEGIGLRPDLRRIYERLNSQIDSYNQMLLEQGIIKDASDPLAHMKEILGNDFNTLPIDQAALEYSSKVSTMVARNRLRNLMEELDMFTLKPGEVGKTVPGVTGKELPEDVANIIAAGTRDLPESGLGEAVKDVNSLFRGLWASADASFIGIQGLLAATSNPASIGQVMKHSWEIISDPAFLGRYLINHDESVMGTGKWTSKDMIRLGLHIAGEHSELTPTQTGIIGAVGRAPGIKQFNRLFTNSGDVVRMSWADSLWRPGITDDEARQMFSAINRATGYSRQAFGGSIGEAAFFAPRFLQSQLETVVNGFAGIRPGSTIEQSMARNQLLRLIGVGVGITTLANAAKGEETVWDPRDSNFMRIRDVFGSDVSVFGPWDSLVRAISTTVKDRDPEYVLRSKASPLVGLGWSIVSGETFMGKEVDITDPNWDMAKEALLPFSWRDIGEEQLPLILASFAGVKTTPLTESEELDKKMQGEGLNPNDPLDRAQYLEAHPEDRPEPSTKAGKEASSIREAHDAQMAKLDTAVQADQMSLVDWREYRKLAKVDERARLQMVVSDSIKGRGDKKKLALIDSFMQLYAESTDDVTGQLDPDKLDELEAKWHNDHSQADSDYIEQFLLVGKSGVEKQFLQDMQQLDKLGYFDMQRYMDKISDLDDRAIEKYRDLVSGYRSSDPVLADMDFETAAYIVLQDVGLSDEEIYDIVQAKESNYNPEYVEFRAKNNKLLQWFNPNAVWSTYQTAGEKEPQYASPRRGGVSLSFS